MIKALIVEAQGYIGRGSEIKGWAEFNQMKRVVDTECSGERAWHILRLKKRWQEYTEELYKNDLHDPDNHDGVITHLEPDILECKIKWALGSITMSKASGGDGIPGELFQILKDDVVKVLHSICLQIWKTQQWPQNWKRPVFIPINPKERQCLRMLKLLHNCAHLTH